MALIQRIKMEIRLWQSMRAFKKEVRRYKLSQKGHPRKEAAPGLIKAIRGYIGAASEAGHD